ncbi:MAG TPA: hypothetical protein PLC88_09745 [Syntrophomonas sp.]|nr:hypothetical protein [Syntrophomonas sp.]
MKISRREKNLLLVAVYLLIIFGGYKLMIAPNQPKLAEVQAVNQQLNQQIEQAVESGKKPDDSQSAISKELAAYMKLEEQLPRDKQLVELVDQIGTIASDNKVILLGVNYTQAKEAPKTAEEAAQQDQDNVKAALAGVSKMDLTLNVNGSYYNLLGFLQDLERSSRIIIVNSAGMSVGQFEDKTTTGSTGGTGTTYTSNNPPPPAPEPKITRIQPNVSTGSAAAPVQVTVNEPAIPEIYKYNMSNVQLNLQITSFYDSSPSEIEKLLGTNLFHQLTGQGSALQTDENLAKVTAAVKKYWNQDDPTADWSNSRNPGEDCWNGQLLKYLEGKYNNTNMGKNVRDLVNPLAATVNPESKWAGTAILHWDKILDLNMTSTVKPVDPDTKQTFTNVKTRDFLPAAVYITYLPNYAPDKVETLSQSQKQAILGSVIVWQAQNSKTAPVVYRIDENGKMQDLQKL